MKLGVVVSSAAVQFELCYFSELNDHFLPLVIQFRTSDFSACPSYSEFFGIRNSGRAQLGSSGLEFFRMQ